MNKDGQERRLKWIRGRVEKEEHSIDKKHAFIEALKDGVTPEDIEYVLLNGEIIEDYPERFRCLIYGLMLNGLPLHVLCDYYSEEWLRIGTVYIPDSRQGIKYKIRKKVEGK